MMMLYRLVSLIETHSQALAACLLDRVQSSEATPDYRNVPSEELKERVYEIYRHLGEWLISKDEFDLEKLYLEIGARRAQHPPHRSGPAARPPRRRHLVGARRRSR